MDGSRGISLGSHWFESSTSHKALKTIPLETTEWNKCHRIDTDFLSPFVARQKEKKKCLKLIRDYKSTIFPQFYDTNHRMGGLSSIMSSTATAPCAGWSCA